MKIDLYMKDKDGVKARIVADGQRWDALNAEDIDVVKKFEPIEYCEIVIFHNDGSIYRHGLVSRC